MPDIATVAIVGAGAIGASLAARLFDSASIYVSLHMASERRDIYRKVL